MEDKSKINISRREFLKFSGMGIAASFIPSVLSPLEEIKVPGPEKEPRPDVGFDEKGVLHIDNKPIVPVVMFGLPGNHDEEESWRKAADLGVNIVTMVYPTTQHLEFAEKYAMKLFVRIDYAFHRNYLPAYSPTKKTLELSKEELFKQWSREYKGLLRALENHPAVIGWEVDEPDRYKTGDAKNNPFYNDKVPPMKYLKPFIEWMQENSRHNLPLRVTSYGGEIEGERERFLESLYERYGGNVVAGPDVYAEAPFIYKFLKQYENYWQKNSEMNKSIWGVISAHSDPSGTLIKDVDSLDEEKILQFLTASVIAGSRALSFYDNPFNCNFEECKPNIEGNGKINAYGRTYEPLRQALEIIEPAKKGLLGKVIDSGLSRSIAYRKFIYGRKTYVFCYNLGEQESKFILSKKSRKTFINLRDRKVLTPDKEWNIKVELEPGQPAIFVSQSNRVI